MKKILIVEGNLKEENQSFTEGGIKTHTESLKDSISYFTNDLEIDVVAECTGIFTTMDKAALHIDAGAKNINIKRFCRFGI